MADDATISDGDATVAARSPARITDSMTAVLNPDDPNTLKGPDPSEWPAAQLVPSEEERRDYEVKGPDPEKWPQTDHEALQTAVNVAVGGNGTIAREPPRGGATGSVQIEQPYNSAPDVVTGVVEPPT